MVEIVPIDLADAKMQIGSLYFVRAEWWRESPRFVLLRYAVNGYDVPLGIRLDMDKKAILDSVDDPALDAQIRNRRFEIWDAVARKMPQAVTSKLAETA